MVKLRTSAPFELKVWRGVRPDFHWITCWFRPEKARRLPNTEGQIESPSRKQYSGCSQCSLFGPWWSPLSRTIFQTPANAPANSKPSLAEDHFPNRNLARSALSASSKPFEPGRPAMRKSIACHVGLQLQQSVQLHRPHRSKQTSICRPAGASIQLASSLRPLFPTISAGMRQSIESSQHM